MNAKAAGQAFSLLFVQQWCPQHSLCSAGCFPSKTNCPFLKLCMFGVDKGMWVGKGEKVSAAAANHAVTAGRSSPVSTNTAFSYPRAFLSSLNPKTQANTVEKIRSLVQRLNRTKPKEKRIGWPLTVVANHAIKLSTTNWSPWNPHLPSPGLPPVPVPKLLFAIPSPPAWVSPAESQSRLLSHARYNKFPKSSSSAVGMKPSPLKYCTFRRMTPLIVPGSIKCFQLRRVWCYEDLRYREMGTGSLKKGALFSAQSDRYLLDEGKVDLKCWCNCLLLVLIPSFRYFVQIEDDETRGLISLRKGLPKAPQRRLYFEQQVPELNLFRLKEELLFAFWPLQQVTCLWVF